MNPWDPGSWPSWLARLAAIRFRGPDGGNPYPVVNDPEALARSLGMAGIEAVVYRDASGARRRTRVFGDGRVVDEAVNDDGGGS